MADTNSGGIGFAGVLTVMFIGMKLGHIIAWPWIWVLSPLWISLAAGLAILGIVFLIAIVYE